MKWLEYGRKGALVGRPTQLVSGKGRKAIDDERRENGRRRVPQLYICFFFFFLLYKLIIHLHVIRLGKIKKIYLILCWKIYEKY